MIRRIAYWSSTVIVALALLGSLSYLTGSEQVVSGFYAGTTFALVMAFIAAYAIGDGPQVWAMPLVLLALLAGSYVTRPASRRVLVAPPAGTLADESEARRAG